MNACDQQPPRIGVATAAPALALSEQRAGALLALWASLAGCLPSRILGYVDALKARGDRMAYARPAHYRADAAGSATAATYSRTLDRSAGPLVLVSVEHPQEGGADVIASALRVGGYNRIDSDVLCDGWCDPEGTTEDPRNLTHPLVVGTGDTFSLDVTGSALLTTGIQLRGYHVDEVTAEIIAQGGELYLEGLNRTHPAATVMTHVIDRVVRAKKHLTHLVAKETLAGDAVRANIGISIKGHRYLPAEGAVVPPRGLMKAAARISVDLEPNDSIQVQTRYTSAGGAGVARLQMTMMGRRRFR